ncbi:hypothetical protein EDD37DRAFT_272326 [Exophiala viscosa]|uniref:Uncharacterized protein n=1 Tax=Exophiala viscosa TaxID=2486360 RepID=A0AAN6E5P1_9EURO|nr:hypothetical protein EDD36DRAFT_35371 [Exophiala viscosa]KAI1627688.1 hypothetical protein EDD37DRAFT_272326 [Exophiala viscosa]
MYRKSSGAVGFSFNRLITNAFPNFANDNPGEDADLTSTQKDLLWVHQLGAAETRGRSPMTLDEDSAFSAGITTSEKNSARIHKELVKNRITDPAAPLGIDTTRITQRLPHELAFVSIHAQRKTVGMLFFWEQEALRWRLLDQEESELKAALEDEGTSAASKQELKVRLEGVSMRRGMRPSSRQEEAESSAHQEAHPPQYS